MGPGYYLLRRHIKVGGKVKLMRIPKEPVSNTGNGERFSVGLVWKKSLN